MIFSRGAGRHGGHPVSRIEKARPARRGAPSRLLTACVLALLLPLAACKGREQRAAELAQKASQLSEAGDRNGAIQAIQQAIALRDDKADYFMLQASIELRANRAVEAFMAGRRALELDAANSDALGLVANVGMQIGQIDDANDAANRLLALDPDSLVGLQVKGLYELHKNRNAEAEVTAQRLLQISPADIAGIIIHTRVLAQTGKFEEALSFINERIGLSEASAPLLITQINLNRVLGRPQEMIKAFDQLDQIAPERSAALRLDEINLLYQLGRTADARVKTAELFASRKADVGELLLVQRLWWEYDPLPFTRQTLQAAKDWHDPMILTILGHYFLWQGQPQLADDSFFLFNEAVRAAGFAIHLRAAMKLGNVPDLRSLNDQVLDRDAENVDALLLRAEFEERDGHRDLAIEAVQRALNADKTDPEVYVMLAELHARAGAKARAQQVFEDGLQQMPQDFLLVQHYTQFLHQSGNKSRAVSVSRAFARALPSSAKAWTIMAQQCAWAADAACAAEAAAGRTAAPTRYRVDDPPGTPPDRGLLGKF
jgi:predicted Zn-dependent protease